MYRLGKVIKSLSKLGSVNNLPEKIPGKNFLRNSQSEEGKCVIFSIAVHYYTNVKNERNNNLPENDEESKWENLVRKTFGDNLLNGIVGTKDLSNIEQRTKCPITLYQLNSLNLTSQGVMKYEIRSYPFPQSKLRIVIDMFAFLWWMIQSKTC